MPFKGVYLNYFTFNTINDPVFIGNAPRPFP